MPDGSSMDIFDGPTHEPRPKTASQEYTYEVGNQPWAKAIKAAGGKIGPNNWPHWQGLIEKHDLPVIIAAAGAIAAADRWPPNVEDYLRKSNGQISLGKAVAHKTIHITT